MYLCFASIGVIVFTSTKKMKNSHLTIIQPQAHTKLNPALAIVVDAVSKHAREGLLNEILYADDLVLMSENLEDLREMFQRWRDALEKIRE